MKMARNTPLIPMSSVKTKTILNASIEAVPAICVFIIQIVFPVPRMAFPEMMLTARGKLVSKVRNSGRSRDRT